MNANHLGGLIAVCALAVVTPASAQTTGAPWMNDFTINGGGSGGTSPVPLNLSTLDPVIELNVTAPPGHLVFGMAAANVQVGAYAGPPVALGSLDLEPTSLTIWYPGAPLIPGIPLGNVVPASGLWLLAVVNGAQGGEVLHLQFAVFDPVSGGFSATQAHSGIVAAFSGPTTVYKMPDDSSVPHGLAVPVEFFAQTYNTMEICSNGYIKFGAGNNLIVGTTNLLFAGIPSATSPAAPAVAPLWTDLNPGGMTGPSTYEVWENTIDNTVQVIFRNQEYFTWNEPAGTFSVTFTPPVGLTGQTSVIFDYTGWIPGLSTVGSDPMVIGVSDGDILIGPDTDFTYIGGFAGALNTYSSTTSFESMAEFFATNAAFPFSFIELVDTGGIAAPGYWSLFGW